MRKSRSADHRDDPGARERREDGRNLPEFERSEIACDFRENGLSDRVKEARIEWHSIAPGKPTQNAIVESFKGRLRDACLKEHPFGRLSEARNIIETWRIDYNTVRPHTSLGVLAPAMFADQANPARFA